MSPSNGFLFFLTVITLLSTVLIILVIYLAFPSLKWRRAEARAGRCGHLDHWLLCHRHGERCRTCQRNALRAAIERRVDLELGVQRPTTRRRQSDDDQYRVRMSGAPQDEDREQGRGPLVRILTEGIFEDAVESTETLPRYEEPSQVSEDMAPPGYEEVGRLARAPLRLERALLREERWREVWVGL